MPLGRLLVTLNHDIILKVAVVGDCVIGLRQASDLERAVKLAPTYKDKGGTCTVASGAL